MLPSAAALPLCCRWSPPGDEVCDGIESIRDATQSAQDAQTVSEH